MDHPSQVLCQSIASRARPSKRLHAAWGGGWVLGLLVVVAGGCAVDAGDLDLLIVRSSVVQEEPLDPSLVTWLRVRVEGPGMGVRQLDEPFVHGATTRLPGVLLGPARVFQLEGRASEDGAVVSRGESVPVDLDGGGGEIELYVGLVGRFSTAGGEPLLDPRGEATLVAATPGTLLLTGGRAAEDGAWVGTVETFDPSAGKVRLSGDCRGAGVLCLRAPRSGHAALPLEGAVLLLGGRGPDGLVTAIERCSVAGCSERGRLSRGRVAMAVAPDANFGGFVVGGGSETGTLAEVLHVAPDGEVSAAPALPEPRSEAGAAVANDGSLIVFGGRDAAGEVLGAPLRLRPGAGAFEPVPEGGASPRAGVRAVAISDGRVLFVGGGASDGRPSSEVDLFDPETGLLCPVGHLRLPVSGHSVSALRHGRALVAGGLGPASAVVGEASLLDTRFIPPATRCEAVAETLEVLPAGRLRHPRWKHAAAATANGLVVIAGGYGPDGSPVGAVEIYVP